ncbi:MAG: hypothetical protein LBI68_01035 [Azoarcus sp.]|nr:hypothetical protein [Azoarcus sp.]
MIDDTGFKVVEFDPFLREVAGESVMGGSMVINESGVLPQSLRFIFTPSS